MASRLAWAVAFIAAAVLGSRTVLGGPAAEEGAEPVLPSDAQLEQAQYRIGEIRIAPQDIFDPADSRESGRFYRAANRLHVKTHASVIRAFLLFREGDAYSARLLAESERALRAAPYLRDVAIRPVFVHDDRVDVEVRTRDVWTFDPGLSFLRRGGTNTSGVSLADLSLIGTGISLSAARTTGVDRTESRIDVQDGHVAGTHFSVQAGYASNSDGSARQLFVERPFYSLDTSWAFGVSAWSLARTDSLYDRGAIIDQFRESNRFIESYFGWSAGLEGRWVRRWAAGMTYDAHEFAPVDGSPASGRPPDRRLAAPWLQLDLLENEYTTLNNHDQIARTEDLHLGLQAHARLGVAAPAFGSDRRAELLQISGSHTARPLGWATLRTSLALDGRREQGSWRNTSLEVSSRAYFEQSSRWLLYLDLEGTWTHALDPDHQVLLGGDSGLRGYPLRYQYGTSRALMSIEQRYFTNWYPLRLFRVGGAVFFDAGRTWGQPPLAASSLGLLRDVGLGLRIANSRLGFGGVLHVDLAFPLDGERSIRSRQLIVEAKSSF